MPAAVWEAVIILLLILANGFFALAEIAIIAARRSRLKQSADEGNRAAQLALDLAQNPNRFLPTVQLGISLVGTAAAAFGGATLVEGFAETIRTGAPGWLADNADTLALTAVVLILTFFSVLIGELVPKRLALMHADLLAHYVAWPMSVLSRLGTPFVWVMATASDALLTLFGAGSSREPSVSVEDIEHVIRTGTEEGLLESTETKVALEALRLGERTARDILQPRTELDALDVTTPWPEVLGAVAMSGHSRLPVYEGDLDHIIGFVHIKDVLRRHYLGLPTDLRKLIHPVLLVPETLPIDRLLMSFQEQGSQIAVVLDEFGGTEGIVTLQDVLEELVGELHDEHDHDRNQEFVQRDERSWLVDGSMSLDDFCEKLSIKQTDTGPRRFSTVAGLALSELGRIPRVGDQFQWEKLRMEIVDMDGQRIDRLLVSLPEPVEQGPG